MQELVDENAELILDQSAQYTGAKGDEAVRYTPQRVPNMRTYT